MTTLVDELEKIVASKEKIVTYSERLRKLLYKAEKEGNFKEIDSLAAEAQRVLIINRRLQPLLVHFMAIVTDRIQRNKHRRDLQRITN